MLVVVIENMTASRPREFLIFADYVFFVVLRAMTLATCSYPPSATCMATYKVTLPFPSHRYISIPQGQAVILGLC